MTTAAHRLPPELLSECLRAADLPTRIRASHVSRRWRSIALSDSTLWNSFSCTIFWGWWHQDAVFDQLQAMLRRSRSRPFRLQIPHRYHGGLDAYCVRLLALEGMDIRRLASYAGPLDVFSRLIQERTLLPTLESLCIIDPNVAWDYVTIDLTGLFTGNSLPNLETLQAHVIRFSTDSCPFPALQHLTCSLNDADDILPLLEVFPNVVNLQITNIESSWPFPPISLPASLRTIVLCPLGRCELSVPQILEHWEGMQIPEFVLRAADNARGVLPLFAAMHSHTVNLRLNGSDGEILLSTPDDEFRWTITPSQKDRETFLSGLETRSCERLTSISVGMEQLGRFLAAGLHVPALDRLEFRLDGSEEPPVLQAGDDSFVIRVPRLQHVTFTTDGRSDAIGDRLDEIQIVLVVLRASFRSLVVYDAEMLESITLSAPAACVQKLDSAAFASFAKDYRVSASE